VVSQITVQAVDLGLTDDHKVDIFWEQLAPLHASQRDVAVILLTRRLVKELVEEDERKNVGVVKQVVGGAGKALYNEVGKVRVGSAR
jgi:hypothetical protein